MWKIPGSVARMTLMRLRMYFRYKRTSSNPHPVDSSSNPPILRKSDLKFKIKSPLRY